MHTTASTAPVSPGIISAAPEATPNTTMVQVSWSGVTRVRTSCRVNRNDTRRMYSRPAQCSPLRLASLACGWTTSRSSSRTGAATMTVLPSPGAQLPLERRWSAQAT
jgi:hypothetical protein